MSFFCPFCQQSIAESPMTHRTRLEFFDESVLPNGRHVDEKSTHLLLNTFKCSECHRVFFSAEGVGEYIEGMYFPIYPRSNCKQFPEYVPAPIREDYQEAYEILDASPKASATLARRCLQGMIRDFWGISKNRLIDEIEALQEVVPPYQWKAIDAVRKVGNIGAHMEKDTSIIVDIDPEEAKLLLDLVEYLIYEWYISKHESSLMMDKIKQLSEKKESLRRPG